jgi:hypothetical protein
MFEVGAGEAAGRGVGRVAEERHREDLPRRGGQRRHDDQRDQADRDHRRIAPHQPPGSSGQPPTTADPALVRACSTTEL